MVQKVTARLLGLGFLALALEGAICLPAKASEVSTSTRSAVLKKSACLVGAALVGSFGFLTLRQQYSIPSETSFRFNGTGKPLEELDKAQEQARDSKSTFNFLSLNPKIALAKIAPTPESEFRSWLENPSENQRKGNSSPKFR